MKFRKDPPKGKHAWCVKVGERGQLVIPKEARALFGIEPGDTLLLLGDERRGLAIPPKGAFAALTEMLLDGSQSLDEPEE